ncbi:hypothetical protein T01_3510 [Trichinella spiralis]|uniref:Uncharacterized protein n=1 Tax=Trichinella spiralis TaxID=6334 RepID=A0A0V1B7U9_TRISP|nr:hypothetical protein T01_3510 [Trichinella spiralis]
MFGVNTNCRNLHVSPTSRIARRHIGLAYSDAAHG